MQFLKVYQIYYKPEQLAACDYNPYLNKNCSVYFENSVISELVNKGEHSDSKYFGVVSWNLRNKIKNTLGPRVGIKPFYADALSNTLAASQPDIMGLQQYRKHDPLKLFPGIHKELPKFFKKVVADIGLPTVSTSLEHNFYCNHFIAKSDIYERYVLEVLNPAISVMDAMPELMIDSGYPRPLPIDLIFRWGISYYPYHTFICERLFGYWVSLNKFNVKYY